MLVTRLGTLKLITLAMLGMGCGSSADPGDNGSAQDPGAPPVWKTLISGEWTMRPGTEGYTCVRQTVQEDFFVDGFEAINPLGTHHTLLTMGEPNLPDGLSPCNAGANHSLSVFGSGVGTDVLEFPKGVALKITKGTQLLLNLHLFNTGTEGLSGTSGTRVRTVAESDVVHIAEGLLAGKLALDIPAGQTTTHVGYCSMSSDVTLFAVAPHMHQLGIHEKAVAESSIAGEVTLMDEPYDFNEQSYRLIDPVAMARGDRVRVECTHRNTTSKRVTFGESTLSEMCFAGVYRFPADGSPLICSTEFEQ
jgi:hypothetical protein